MSGNRQVGDTEHIRHNKQNEEGETVTQHKQTKNITTRTHLTFIIKSLHVFVGREVKSFNKQTSIKPLRFYSISMNINLLVSSIPG
jgi:hypothetical protein